MGVTGRFAKKLLDMSNDARMARAKEQGLDTDVYRGSLKNELNAQDVINNSDVNGVFGKAFYTTDSAFDASKHYASKDYDASARVSQEVTRRLNQDAALGRGQKTQAEYISEILAEFPELERGAANVAQLKINASNMLDLTEGGYIDADTINNISDSLKSFDPQSNELSQMIDSVMERAKDGDGDIPSQSFFSEVIPELGLFSDGKGNDLSGQLIQDGIKKSGYDGVIHNASIFEDMMTPEMEDAYHYISFSPDGIRSVNAAFDPAKKDSSNLLAGVGGAAVGAGALLQSEGSEAMEVDTERADKLERLYTLYKEKGDKQGQLKALKAMKAMKDDIAPIDNPSHEAFIQAQEEMTGIQGSLDADGRRRGLPAKRTKLRQLESQQAARQQAIRDGSSLARDLPEIGSAPEMNAFNMDAVKASLGATFTFDNKEVGDILQAQLGAEISQDPEGNFIASLPSGSYAINKPGFSAQDLIKTGATVAAFTPAGRLATIPAQAAAGAATAAAIETGQTALGGEFSVTDVALEAAFPVALNKMQKLAVRARPRSHAVAEYIEDTAGDNAVHAETKAVADKFQPLEAVDKPIIRQSIEDGTVDAAGWKLDKKSNKVVKDPVQRQLLREGISEKLVVSPNRMTSGDKAAINMILDKAEAFVRGVKGSELDIPQRVIGDNAMARFKVIAKAQREASKRIRSAVEKDLTGRPVVIDDIIEDFLDDLGDLGVGLKENKLDFSQSMISGSNTRPIKDIYQRLKPSWGNAAELHKLKRYISKQLDYDKKSPLVKSLDDDAERALKAVRAKINKRLQSLSDDYRVANEDFSEAASTLVPFADEMGIRFDPESTRVDAYVGQELRKVITNYAKANDMIVALSNLDSLAKQYGGKFSDDLYTQIMFNSELEGALGSFKPGSMQGVIEKGAEVAARQSGLTGDASTIYHMAKDRIVVPRASEDKLKLINNLRALVNQ